MSGEGWRLHVAKVSGLGRDAEVYLAGPDGILAPLDGVMTVAWSATARDLPVLTLTLVAHEVAVEVKPMLVRASRSEEGS